MSPPVSHVTGLNGEPSPALAERRLASPVLPSSAWQLESGLHSRTDVPSCLHNPFYCIVCTEFEVYFLMNVQLAVCFNMVKEINDMVFIKVPWVL